MYFFFLRENLLPSIMNNFKHTVNLNIFTVNIHVPITQILPPIFCYTCFITSVDPSNPVLSTAPSYFPDAQMLILAYRICLKWYPLLGLLQNFHSFLTCLKRTTYVHLETSFALVSLHCLSQRMKHGSADGLSAMVQWTQGHTDSILCCVCSSG